jgi:WhiB family redox-sensing transcriptional regulator
VICRRCPVRDSCLAYALENNETHGVWGGMTPQQRKDLRRLSRGDWRGLAS